MNILLIFFALPLATIILAIVLQKLIKCPILVAAIFFAIYLIVAFAVFDATFLISAIVYTFLAFVTASIVKIICSFIRNCNWCSSCNCREDNCSCRRNMNTTATNNVLALNEGNDTFRISNENGCTCRVTCTNSRNSNFNNGYNRGYNRGYNNGYDNGYNNAFDFWNDNEDNANGCSSNSVATVNNVATANNSNSCGCGCNCRRRCR